MTTTPPPPPDPNEPPSESSYPVYPGTPAEEPDPSTDVGGLPTHPGSSPGESGRAAATAQPSSIRLAVRLMWAGAALSVVSLIVTLATLDSLKSDIRDSLRKSDANYTQSSLDAAYSIAIGGAVFAALVGVGLWLWMAWKNGEGRRWARVVATVLGGINLLSTLYTLTAGRSTAASMVLAVVNLVLAAVILVLLWRKESSDFYSARSQPRMV
jgi:hypothetical protein